jgi:hypothetical protein
VHVSFFIGVPLRMVTQRRDSGVWLMASRLYGSKGIRRPICLSGSSRGFCEGVSVSEGSWIPAAAEERNRSAGQILWQESADDRSPRLFRHGQIVGDCRGAFVCRDFANCRKTANRPVAGDIKTHWIHNGFGSRMSGMSRALVHSEGIGTRQ